MQKLPPNAVVNAWASEYASSRTLRAKYSSEGRYLGAKVQEYQTRWEMLQDTAREGFCAEWRKTPSLQAEFSTPEAYAALKMAALR